MTAAEMKTDIMRTVEYGLTLFTGKIFLWDTDILVVFIKLPPIRLVLG